MMLRIGLYLLSTSSFGVLYRAADLTYSTNTGLDWSCLAGLILSIICFVGTYLRHEAPHRRNIFLRGSDMIKSSTWKLSLTD